MDNISHFWSSCMWYTNHCCHFQQHDGIITGAEYEGIMFHHVAWPVHASCNVWIIQEAAHLMLKDVISSGSLWIKVYLLQGSSQTILFLNIHTLINKTNSTQCVNSNSLQDSSTCAVLNLSFNAWYFFISFTSVLLPFTFNAFIIAVIKHLWFFFSFTFPNKYSTNIPPYSFQLGGFLKCVQFRFLTH